MTDLKLSTGTFQAFQYGPYAEYLTDDPFFFNIPDGVTVIRIKMWGPGGGGGGASATADGGAGGGGGYLVAQDIPVNPGDFMLALTSLGGTGATGTSTPTEAGGGGGAGGFAGLVNQTQGIVVARCGGGGGGGGGNGGSAAPEARGGHGGAGGSATADDGGAPPGATETTGGGGGAVGVAGLGGTGELPGDPGAGVSGGDGADGSGAAPGSSAPGGNNGGNGGRYDINAPGGGGGGGGDFSGGGGGSGDSVELEGGGGGGGGASLCFYPTLKNEKGSGSTPAGTADPDYPGGGAGFGGAAGVVGSENGGSGIIGGVLVSYGGLTTINAENDLTIENDAPVLVNGVDQIAQHVRSILLICQGEWFLNEGAGTPWFTRVLGQKYNGGQINATVRDAILSVPGVASIENIRTNRDRVNTWTINITVEVLTDTGELVSVDAEI